MREELYFQEPPPAGLHLLRLWYLLVGRYPRTGPLSISFSRFVTGKPNRLYPSSFETNTWVAWMHLVPAVPKIN